MRAKLTLLLILSLCAIEAFGQEGFLTHRRKAFRSAGGGTGLTTNLIAYWKLDEASGTRNDSHGSNHLSNNNTVGSNTGKINSGAEFVAANSEYLSIADNTDLSCGDVDFTWMGWIKATSLSGLTIVAHKGWAGSGGNDNREWVIYTLGSDIYAEFGHGTSSKSIQIASGISTGTWYQIFIWHDSVNDLVGCQLDNGSANTSAHASGVNDGNNPYEIGAYSSGSAPFDGIIDEVAFWKNRVLSSGDRTTLNNSGSGLAYGSF